MKYFLTITNICLLSFSLSFGQITRNVPSQYSTIQAAIDASINGDTVLVQPGFYFERINFNGKSIIVSSTFILSNDTNSISNTIIDGSYLPNVVTFNHSETSSAKLIGFTIQNGYYNGGNSEINGAGILIDGASPEIRNCTIRNNLISWYGGGICVKNGSEPFLSSLTLYDNIAQHHGGGIAILGAKPKLVNILLYNNSTGALGGGIYVSSFPRTEIINCTVLNNFANGYAGHYGGGIYTTSGSNIFLMNSIVWENVPNQIDDEFNQTQPVFYSNIQGGYAGTGNINLSPIIHINDPNDYSLPDNSPCIGKGIDSVYYGGRYYYSPNYDILQHARPQPSFSFPDLGAFENQFAEPQRSTLINVPDDYLTIQEAINNSISGDTILVAPGIYTERINFSGNAILIASNFIFSSDSLDILNTILDGNQLPNVVTFNHNENNDSKLIGFTIQNGRCPEPNTTLNGAGILIDGASPVIANCILKNNTTFIYGGAICLWNSGNTRLINLKITNNHSSYHGGGIAIISSSAELINLLITDNSTNFAYGGGLYINNSDVKVVNCTIAENSSMGYMGHYGGGISTNNSGQVFVMNSIVWNNTPDQISDQSNQQQTVQYSNVEGGYTGIGNINLNPKFTNSTNNNFRLTDYSPSIGSGIDSVFYSGIWYAAPDKDLDLNPRPNPIGSSPDQGAYENFYGTPQHKTLVQVPGDYATIQEAINEVIDGDTVLVLPGNYNENIDFNNKNILLTSNVLYNRDSLIVNQTKIIAQSILYPTVKISSGKLLGFTIQGGNGGISIPIYSSIQIDFCFINDNINVGIGASSSQIEIMNCKIFNNMNVGVSLLGCTGSLKGSKIFSNNGSGLHLWEMSGNFEIENNLFIGNDKGVSTFGQNPATITNCTIYGNEYGVFCQEGSAFNIKNSIIFNTGIPILINNSGVNILEIDYSIIENGQGGIVNNSITSIITYGDNNIDYNPLFINASSNDFHLSEFSPAIGSGTSVGAPMADIEGNPRPNPAGSNPDIGAYESPLAHFDLLPPVLSLVSNGAINQPTEVQLIWYPVYGSTEYRFQLSSDSTFSNTIIDQTNYLDTTILVSALDFLTTYFWRVNASYPYDTSAWSDVWSFETIIQAPEVPELVSPLNNSFNHQTNILLSWNHSLRSETYQLQIATDSSFSNIIFQDSVITDTSKFISNLSNNTSYYWRVNAKNIGGQSNYSESWSFRTLLDTAILYTPANNSFNVSNNPVFSWSNVQGAANYHIQISLTPSFTQIIIEDSLITDTLIQKGPLNFSTLYYWRIRAYDNLFSSQFSEPFSFSTIIEAPEIPELLLPTNNSFNLQTSQEFIWHPSLRAEVYHLQISTDSLFSTITAEDSLITDSTKSISGLSNNTQFYWRVRAINVGGYSNFSDYYKFRTLLQTPFLQSPTNGALNVSINPTFAWDTIPGATNYHIQISLNSSFTQIVMEDSLVTNSTIQLGPLNNSSTYYWRVRGYDGVYSSLFSNPFVFATIISNPNFPILIAPLDGSVNQPLNTTFIWDTVSSATSYRLQVSIDSLFGSFIFNDSSIITNSRIVNLPNNNQKYFWRVQAKNVGGYSQFSSVWHLITILPAPFLSSIEVGNKEIQISWNQIPLANVQQTNIYRDITPNPTNLIESVPVGLNSFIDTGLTNGITYYYRIKTVSTYGVESEFSNQLSSAPFNSPPVAVALNNVFLPDEGKVLTKQLTFSSSGSFDPDGSIDSIKWYVNDEFILIGNDLAYDFSQGTHKVSLIVIDNDGEKDTSIATVTRSMFRNIVNGQVVAGLSLIGDNILYAIVNGDAVYKMDKDGNIDYTLQVGGNLLASSSIANDSSVYIGSTDNNIYAFSKSGTSLWVRALGGAVTTTPTIDILNDRVYVGVSNRNFQFLDRATGSVLGNYFSDAPINTSAVITADNKLFFSTVKGTMYGFDLSNITLPNVTPTWAISSTDTISSSPAIDEEGFFYVGTKNGLLKKISMQSGLQGTVVWQANLGGEIIASPVIDATGNIYVGSSNADFFCVDRTDGDIKWNYTFGGQIKTAAAISDQARIYFGTENGYIYCVDTTGSTLWQYKDSTSICNSLLYSDGVLYLGTYGGRLVALYDYDVADRTFVAVNNIWSTFQGNNQRTGEQADRITNIEQDQNSLPSEYVLFNNYPNPYNPSTTIKYGLPFNSQVKIEVFNIIGERVVELLNAEQSSGFYEVVFVANDLASGVYIYKISATSTDNKSSYQAIKKMILLK